MRSQVRTIRIAAALIEDGHGRLLLVRKAGTEHFMQAGGKIEAGESALAALFRELREEIGFEFVDPAPQYLGCFTAEAANEPGYSVEAELFHVRTSHDPQASAEIAEAIWLDSHSASKLTLAPLTRDHVLPLLQTL
jgi:8-oxo-dGTP pyrophosphatase MutT (NUDIX family)